MLIFIKRKLNNTICTSQVWGLDINWSEWVFQTNLQVANCSEPRTTQSQESRFKSLRVTTHGLQVALQSGYPFLSITVSVFYSPNRQHTYKKESWIKLIVRRLKFHLVIQFVGDSEVNPYPIIIMSAYIFSLAVPQISTNCILRVNQ